MGETDVGKSSPCLWLEKQTQCHQHTPGVLTQGRARSSCSIFAASQRRRHHFIPISRMRKLRFSEVSNLLKISLLEVRVRTQIQASRH